MNEESEPDYRGGIRYPAPPQDATLKSLRSDGWEEFRFIAEKEDQKAQQKIDEWLAEGCEVTVIRSDDRDDRSEGAAYVMRKKKS